MLDWDSLLEKRALWRGEEKTVVWTNGCFDLVHTGHVRSLTAAKRLGDILVVGLNSDRSVRAIKGPSRPLIPQHERAELLAALACVDAVITFDEHTPEAALARFRPDVHCKGADYAPPQGKPIPERVIVESYGGRLEFLPLLTGISTTELVRRIQALGESTRAPGADLKAPPRPTCPSEGALDDLLSTLERFRAMLPQVQVAGEMLVETLKRGSKILTAGNGGSAAEAMHMAEELVGRFSGDRQSLPAVCLAADPTVITCIGNDYGFEELFARQVDGLGRAGDCLVAFSSSGNSTNLLAAVRRAKSKGMQTISLLGKDGGKARGLCDTEIIVPSQNAARAQEIHVFVLHAWLALIEHAFYPK